MSSASSSTSSSSMSLAKKRRDRKKKLVQSQQSSGPSNTLNPASSTSTTTTTTITSSSSSSSSSSSNSNGVSESERLSKNLISSSGFCFILMNCHGGEVERHLRANSAFTRRFPEIVHLDNYDHLHDMHLPHHQRLFQRADLLITNNVKNYPGANFSDVIKYIRPTCGVVRIEFFRFGGYWPGGLPEKKSDDEEHYFLPPHYSTLSFDEYIRTHPPQLSDDEMRALCEHDLNDLKRHDRASDIPMGQFVAENYQRVWLFSNPWHPTAPFFKHMCTNILHRIGITGSEAHLPDFPNDVLNDVLVNFVTDKVARALDLKFDLDHFLYVDRIVSRRIFYDFVNFVRDPKRLPRIRNRNDFNTCFHQFIKQYKEKTSSSSSSSAASSSPSSSSSSSSLS